MVFIPPPPTEHETVLQTALIKSQEENNQLRRLLAGTYAGAGLYTDDGELQDNREIPCIDFLRDSVADIIAKMQHRSAHTQKRVRGLPRAQRLAGHVQCFCGSIKLEEEVEHISNVFMKCADCGAVNTVEDLVRHTWSVIDKVG